MLLRDFASRTESPPLGRRVFSFAALHETIHRTAFRTRWLNDGVALICSLVLLLPPRYFRAFHFAHHRHTQDPNSDPELLVPKPATLGQYLWFVSGLPYWFERVMTITRHARGQGDLRDSFAR